jgi:serine/threonine protein kinase
MDIIGQRLAGKYEIKSEIGQGGMGVVYEAQDAMLRRRVAVKVLAPHLAGDSAFVRRFQHEAAAAAGLHHPNIVTIHDVGSERVGVGARRPLYYIVMQLVDGQSLDRWLRQQRPPLALGETNRIVVQVADALQYAHDQGMIHRDVKPSNVMVGRSGHVTLMDFGLVWANDLSQLTQSGVALGTPSYMAPEQITGGAIDRRTDVYALGVVLYELLAGEAPFVRDTPVATAHAHVYEPPPPLREKRPDLPPAVESVVLKALAKTPANRYSESRLLAADLAAAATGQIPVDLYSVKEATVPMAHPPRPAAARSDDTTPAEQAAASWPDFDATLPPGQPLPEPRRATPEPDVTVADSRAAPISAWESLPLARPAAPSPPVSPMPAPAQVAPPPRVAPSAWSQGPTVWIGVGLGLLLASILVWIGLADRSLGVAAVGVLIGVGAMVVAAVAGRARTLHSTPRQPSASGYTCLRCGHELPHASAPCPSCGYKG